MRCMALDALREGGSVVVECSHVVFVSRDAFGAAFRLALPTSSFRLVGCLQVLWTNLCPFSCSYLWLQ